MYLEGRRAPSRFSGTPNLQNAALWRDLKIALVPVPCNNGAAGTFVHCGRDMVRGEANTFNGTAILAGEACGIALKSVAAGISVNSPVPHAPPFSCFAFFVNRDTSPGNIQAICGDKQGGIGGAWTFQLSYGSGQLGMTRWGIGDDVTSSLGAVPVGGAHNAAGLSHNGTTARFFLNGRFENVTSGAFNGNTGGIAGFFMRDSSNAPTNASFYVCYIWARTLSDAEFMVLYQDPWAPVRPFSPLAFKSVAGGGGSGARSFVPAMIG